MPTADQLLQPDPIGDVERYVADGPIGGWDAGARGPRRWIRRALLRVVRPYASRQAELDADIARSLRHLQQQIDDRA